MSTNKWVCLAAVGMAIWCAIPMAPAQEAEAEEERPFDRFVAAINESKPGVIMVGNSMQGAGIDFPVLSEAVGVKVLDVRSGGSMSPWQYSILKWVIPAADHTPEVVMVVDRLNYITAPQKRMRWGVYQRAVNGVAGEDRELLDKLAFDGEGLPPWHRQWERGGDPPPESYYWDFNQAVQTSFLPEMIRLSREQGYQLIFVRHKSRRFAEDPDWEHEQSKQYGEDMAIYLHENGIVFLDYVYHPDIKIEHYANGDHLDRQTGRPIWTALMAEDLKAILAGERAPNHRLPAALESEQ